MFNTPNQKINTSGTIVNKIENIPNGENFAILQNNHYEIPAHQRSIDNPGHGYPASTKYYLSFVIFNNKEEMIEWMKKEEARGNSKYIAVKIIKFNKKVNIEIEATLSAPQVRDNCQLLPLKSRDL